MPSPFPGMDPYLERASGWLGFHNSLVVMLGFALNDVLPDNYRAEVDQRVILVEDPTVVRPKRPDIAVLGTPTAIGPIAPRGETALLEKPETVTLPIVEWINESFLEIQDAEGAVVTVLEVLSPTNKSDLDGHRDYEDKRKRVLASETNLVEIDLLRRGRRFVTRESGKLFDYSILIVRAARRPEADLHAFTVREPFPRFALPLRPGESGPIVDLNTVFHETYDRGRYGGRFDYGSQPDPPLAPEDAAWADALLREKGLR